MFVVYVDVAFTVKGIALFVAENGHSCFSKNAAIVSEIYEKSIMHKSRKKENVCWYSKLEVGSRTQVSRPRPGTQKKNPRPRAALPRTDPFDAKDKGKDTSASALQKKRSSQKFFRWSPKKKRLPKNFLGAPKNFNYSKNSAVLESRTGKFSRTWGFEAKAKDLTFEAKAKDFKMCSRIPRTPPLF